MRRSRRLLALLAVAVCVTVAAPLVLAATGVRVVRVPTDTQAVFPGLDWGCHHFTAASNTRATHEVVCTNRARTGIAVFVDRNTVDVIRFYGPKDANGIPASWDRLLKVQRRP